MCALCEADSPDIHCPGCFASLRFVQGAASLAPLMWLTLIIENDKRYSDDRNCCVAKEVSILLAEQI